ncbi:MAG: signal peptidase I [Patescibacteria group bacterium]|nr:signal peptidase I [Patescibacteria group bacterium]MDD4611248.1 signal peptidase I [Patescibacteria group bacterium]
MIKNFFLYIFELVKIIAISLAIIIPIRYYLIQPFYVKGASMEPNFYDHEYLIINEISYRFEEPKRGDIIVFKYPKNPQEYFIKRIIGMPGEKVQIKDGEIKIFNNTYVDGVVLEESYLEQNLKTYSSNEDIISLGENEYYVLGDNRNSSKDSRSFGAVDKSFIVGKVLLRGWPFTRVKLFDTPAYQY